MFKTEHSFLSVSTLVGTRKRRSPAVAVTTGLSICDGSKRIRTAVAAFAELSLVTRPSDPSLAISRRVCEYTQVGSLGFRFRDKILKGAQAGRFRVGGCPTFGVMKSLSWVPNALTRNLLGGVVVCWAAASGEFLGQALL